MAYPLAALVAVGLTGVIWLLLPSVRESGAQHLHDQILPGIHGHRLTDAWLYTFAPAAAWGLTLMLLVFVRWFFSLAARWPRWQGVRRATDRVRSRLLLLTAGWTVLTVLWFAGLLVEYHLIGKQPELYGPGVGGLTALLVTAFARVQKLISADRAESAAASLLARLRPLVPQLLAYALVAVMVMGITGLIVAAERTGGTLPFGVGEIATASLLISLLVLLLMEPNEVGLHAFYRSRLVRAYPGASNDLRAGWPAEAWPGRANPNLPPAAAASILRAAEDPRVPNRETEVVEGDDPRLDALRDGALRPFPLVCCTANDLASRDDMANLSRGGTSAVLSPLGCSVGRAWAP